MKRRARIELKITVKEMRDGMHSVRIGTYADGYHRIAKDNARLQGIVEMALGEYMSEIYLAQHPEVLEELEKPDATATTEDKSIPF